MVAFSRFIATGFSSASGTFFSIQHLSALLFFPQLILTYILFYSILQRRQKFSPLLPKLHVNICLQPRDCRTLTWHSRFTTHILIDIFTFWLLYLFPDQFSIKIKSPTYFTEAVKMLQNPNILLKAFNERCFMSFQLKPKLQFPAA